jgi:DNA mismatch repair protein MSH2
LQKWVSTSNAADDGDIVMEDDKNGTVEAELAGLKQIVEQYRGRIDANPWLQSVLTSL